MDLYRKELKGKRTAYIKHDPYENKIVALEQEQVITLLTTFTMALLMSVSGQLNAHSRAAREISKVENALVGLAKLNKGGIDKDIMELGISAWNAAIREISLHGEE